MSLNLSDLKDAIFVIVAHFAKSFHILFLVLVSHFKVKLCLSCGTDKLYVGSIYKSEVFSFL